MNDTATLNDQNTLLERSRQISWPSLLDRHAHENPDGVALRYQGGTTTWLQLREQSDGLAARLEEEGVREGDRVAVMLLNRPEYFAAVTAIAECGAIAVPINFRLVAGELSYIFENCEIRHVVTEDAFLPLMEKIETSHDWGVFNVDRGLPPAPAVPARRAVSENGPAFIFYTSGTTGRPKGAVLTWRNLQSVGIGNMRAFGYSHEPEIVAAATPLFHIAGIALMMAPLQVGFTVVIQPLQNFDPNELAQLIEDEGITSLFLVPAQWAAMVQIPGVENRMPTLRSIGWGAAPASRSLLEAMSESFPQSLIVACFGQTEMSPVTCVLQGNESLRKIGSVGRAADGVQIRVIDKQGNDVPAGTVGEIVYRGPGMMLGYWNNPEATAEALHGGWFHSGDLVRMDEEGFVYVVDRKKDMIVSGGENVYSVEVEDALSSHEAVAEVAVIGRADERWGERVVAFVALRESGMTLCVEEVRSFLAPVLAAYKHPREVVVVDALPRNPTGKVLKKDLRGRAA